MLSELYYCLNKTSGLTYTSQHHWLGQGLPIRRHCAGGRRAHAREGKRKGAVCMGIRKLLLVGLFPLCVASLASWSFGAERGMGVRPPTPEEEAYCQATAPRILEYSPGMT